jgi:hypothetical protein
MNRTCTLESHHIARIHREISLLERSNIERTGKRFLQVTFFCRGGRPKTNAMVVLISFVLTTTVLVVCAMQLQSYTRAAASVLSHVQITTGWYLLFPQLSPCWSEKVRYCLS